MTGALLIVTISTVTTIIVAGLTGYISYRIQKHRLNLELKGELKADQAITTFLNHIKFERRTFEFLREKIGGYTDDELRKLLVRNGAVREISKKNEAEYWILLSKYVDRHKNGDD